MTQKEDRRDEPAERIRSGGLNYHKEHHLFPAICHVNYPSVSKVVEETCRDFGIPYKEYRSFPAGIAAHYRWLRRMGTAD